MKIQITLTEFGTLTLQTDSPQAKYRLAQFLLAWASSNPDISSNSDMKDLASKLMESAANAGYAPAIDWICKILGVKSLMPGWYPADGMKF